MAPEITSFEYCQIFQEIYDVNLAMAMEYIIKPTVIKNQNCLKHTKNYPKFKKHII